MAQAVRDYDGTGDYTDHEVIDATGALTLVAVIERDANSTWDAIATHQTSADAFRLSLALSNGNRLQLATHNGTAAFAGDSASGGTPFTVTVSDSWCIVAAALPAGATSNIILSKFTPSGGWVHTTVAAAAQKPATHSTGKLRLGRYENTDDLNGKIAAYAEWIGTALSQAEVESLDAGDRQAWKSVAGGYTDLIEPGVQPDGTIAASWATNVLSENGLMDQTGNGGNGTIVTGDLPASDVYTVGVTAGDTGHTQPVNDGIAGTDSLTRVWAAKLTISDTAGLTDNINTGGTTAHTHTVEDAITATDARSTRPGKGLADAASITDTGFEQSIALTIPDAAALTDVINTGGSIAHTRTVNDAVAGTDSLARSFARPLADTVALTDAHGKAVTKALADAGGLADLLARAITRSIADTGALTDARSSPSFPPEQDTSLSIAFTEASTHVLYREHSLVAYQEHA